MHPAYQKMLDFNRQHPESKDIYKQMQLWHLKNNNQDGVFFPTEFIIDFSLKIKISYMTNNYQSKDYYYMSKLQTYGAWRNSLGIYKLDDDIVDDVAKSNIPSDTPIAIFAHLPEFCVYFDMTNLSISDDNTTLLGFWALYDYLPDFKNYRVLKIFFDFGNKVNNIPTDILLSIDGQKTVEQSLTDAFNKTDDFSYKDGSIFTSLKNHMGLTKIALSFLLFLCADEPDISNILGEPVSKDHLRLPRYQINKKTGAFIVPNTPCFYNIGTRLGGEIRLYNERIGQSDDRISSRKRPHIRKGHWHGYWYGTGQAKEFKVKWQPAIFVNSSV